MKKFTSLLFGLSVCLITFSQSSLIKDFDKEIFKENFNSKNTPFHTQDGVENLILVKDGSLFIKRNSLVNYITILSKEPIESNSYRIKTALRFSPSTKKNNQAGIVLNSSVDGRETLAIEINGKQEYRIRKVNTKTTYLSGSASKYGWIKSKHINKNEIYNYIDIISNEGTYDLFINSKHLTTIKTSGLTSGNFGFVVGANSHAIIDYIYVFERVVLNTNKNLIKPKADDIKPLVTKKNELKNESKNLIKGKNTQTISTEKKNILEEKTNKIAALEAEKIELNKKLTRINSLEKENKLLKEKLSIKSPLDKELSASKTSVLELQAKEKELNSKLEYFKKKENDLARIKLENEDFKNSYIKMEGVNTKLNQEVNTLRKDYQQHQILKKKYKVNQELLNKTNTQIHKNNQEIKTMKKSSSSLVTLQGEFAKVKEHNLKLENQLKALDTKYKKLVEYKSKNEDFKTSFNTMKNANDQLTKEVNELKLLNNDFLETKRNYKETQDLLKKTKTHLENKNKEVAILNKKNSSLLELQHDFTKVKSQNSKLENQLKILNAEQNKLKKSEENIRNTLSKYSNSNKGLKDSLSTAQQSNTRLKSEYNKFQILKSKQQELEKRNLFLEKQYDTISAQIEAQKLIAVQFAESYNLEKQKNKQLHNEVLNLYSEEAVSENTKNVVYRVQLGIFDELIDIEGIEDLTTIHTQAHQVIYIAGKFDNFVSARGYLMKMSRRGFKDAFIVKF